MRVWVSLTVVNHSVMAILGHELLLKSLSLLVNLDLNWINNWGLDWDWSHISLDRDVVVLTLISMVMSNGWMVLLEVLLVDWISGSVRSD